MAPKRKRSSIAAAVPELDASIVPPPVNGDGLPSPDSSKPRAKRANKAAPVKAESPPVLSTSLHVVAPEAPVVLSLIHI